MRWLPKNSMNITRCLRSSSQPWVTLAGLRNTSRGFLAASCAATWSTRARWDASKVCCVPLSIQLVSMGTILAIMKHPGLVGARATGAALE